MLSEEIVSEKAQQMFDLIDWFEQICLDPSFNDVGTLIQNYGLISALSVTQARKLRVVSKEFRNAHAVRRINCVIREEELQGKEDPATRKIYTATKSASIALRENQEVYRKEYMNQGEWEGSEVVMKQVNQVLFAMHKMIAELEGTRGSNSKTESDHG